MFHVKQFHDAKRKNPPKISDCSTFSVFFKKETKLFPQISRENFREKSAIPAPLPKWDKIVKKGGTISPNKPKKGHQNAKNGPRNAILGQKKAHGSRIRGLLFVISYLKGNFQRLFEPFHKEFLCQIGLGLFVALCHPPSHHTKFQKVLVLTNLYKE